jgi:RimJ/RimL family protein N-acetyltransferase
MMQSDFAQQLCTPLETPRLMLRPLLATHADMAFNPLQDDAIYQWISMDKPKDLAWLRDRWKRIESRLSPDETEVWATWAVLSRDDGGMMGRVDASIDDSHVCTGFGYYFFPEFWGQGFGTEAVQVSADHLLKQDVQRLIATVTVGNHASAQVLKKAGFIFSRTIPDNDTIRGVLFDDEEYIRTE